jgi:HEXXH motif-containing protein
VPSGLHQVSAIRAAENIVHEAMHLQLTTLEDILPLVADKRARMTSPWREEPRPLLGVLHGAYVFCCIDAFFGMPDFRRLLGNEGTDFVDRRRAQIAGELSQIEFDRLAQGLTSSGRLLLASLRKGQR